MDLQSMKDAILKMVAERPHTSFKELSAIPGFVGDNGMRAPHENLYVWIGVSDVAAKALTALLAEKKIALEPSSFLTYAIDGGAPNLPVAKRMRAYKKPHWLPVTIVLTGK